MVLNLISLKYEIEDNINQTEEDSHQEDISFTDIIFQMLQELPESEEKSMAKTEFQQSFCIYDIKYRDLEIKCQIRPLLIL